jgi:hypothetical protein
MLSWHSKLIRHQTTHTRIRGIEKPKKTEPPLRKLGGGDITTICLKLRRAGANLLFAFPQFNLTLLFRLKQRRFAGSNSRILNTLAIIIDCLLF